MKGVRSIVHRGFVEAAAFFFDPTLLGEDETRRRILALFTPRTRLVHVEGGYLLTVAPAIALQADAAPGLPLIHHDGALVSYPVEDDVEIDHGSALFIRHGRSVIVDLDVATPVDPSTWIDLSTFETITPGGLGDPPKPPTRLEAVQTPIRSLLRDVPTESKALTELSASVAHGANTAHARDEAPSAPPWWTRALKAVRDVLRPRPKNEDTTSINGSEPRPSVFQRLFDAFDRWAMRLLNFSRLSRILGQRQAEYLSRLLQMLENNDVEDALRHAIPLRQDGDEPSRPAFGVPSPRDRLTISAGGGRASSMNVGDDLYALLRRRYRQLFERLDREGRIEEAAFVLAELLGDSEEAVSYLERHKRYKQAAELAESRNLAPGLVVRQWILADDWERAAMLARRDHAFADAVLRLRDGHPDLEQSLRLIWADALADAGDFVGAVNVIWPLDAARHLAQPWIDAAIALGGAVAARMMVLAIELTPAAFDRHLPAILEMLAAEDFGSIHTRRAFATYLVAASPAPLLPALAKPTVRSIYRDASEHLVPTDLGIVRRLVDIADDTTFRADLPPLPRTGLHRSERGSVDIVLEHADTGTTSLTDGAILPSGRFLVALGEAGALLLTRDGRVVKHFDQPCERIVVSDGGHRAIGIARRGEASRLSRFDLVHQRASHWCDTSLANCAWNFDGWHWYVAAHGALDVIDAAGKSFTSVNRVRDCHAVEIAREVKCLATISVEDTGLEVWQFQLPEGTLRRRESLARPEPPYVVVGESLSSAGRVSTLERFERSLDPTEAEDDDPTVLRHWRLASTTTRGERMHPLDIPPTARLEAIVRCNDCCAVAMETPVGVMIRLVDVASGESMARIAMLGAERCGLRLDQRHLVAVDDRGRLVALDHELGLLVRSLRINV